VICSLERDFKAIKYLFLWLPVFVAVAGHRLCASFLQKCQQRNMNCKSLVLTGVNAREQVVDIARQQQVESIVVGSRGLGSIQRMFLGSFSHYIIHHAPCDVIVVKS
jgi:nucleotide-binding universal stress UspA family protein